MVSQRMLTSRIPTDWRDLQESVAAVLRECGFSVEVEKVIDTARGAVEIDVFAEEHIHGRRYVVLCECKHWTARVPQNVIHGFRTVVGDSGANMGYIVSMAGFQSGAMTAAELTNIQLVTWEQFQEAFEATWLEHHLIPTITERLDDLFDCTEPLLPNRFLSLDAARQEALQRTESEA
ncbi:MAG: restriction endonuclease [Acidobacteriia bacterium]|nr:restriction endonuclease [Terriglobia bacterium]